MSAKVVVVISPHADDASIFCGGTLAKLARDGWDVHMIRVTNDEKDSLDLSKEETIAANGREVRDMAEILGIAEIHDLDYINDELDPVSEVEMRGKFVRLFRQLKPQTVIGFDPWGIYEENPDHLKSARAADDACWQAAGHLHHAEHIEEGLEPHWIAERLYYARKLPEINHIVDITETMDVKIDAVCAHKTMMRNMMHGLRSKLAAAGLRIPVLDEITEEKTRVLLDQFLRGSAAEAGQEIGVEYGEPFRRSRFGELDEFIDAFAVPLE